MARFYARFDSGSAGWESGFASGLVGSFFDQLRIAANSASAAPLRDGLIVSRSAVSADVYDDLDAANKDGSKGTYFPPDISALPTPTLLSWSTAYSSSVNGIKTPTTNTYGTGQVNYSLRPTGSVTSSQTTLVAPTNPVDPVQLNYNVYLSASNAVQAVLRAAQTGSGGEISPYTRRGNIPSRTLHSIWHDPTLSYFGWDDFTPGTPIQQNATLHGGLTCGGTAGNYFINPVLRVYYNKQFLNDFNPDGKIDLRINYYSNNVGANNRFDDLLQFDLSGSGTSGNFRYIEYTTSNTGTLGSNNADNINYDIAVTASFYDAIITTSEGARSTQARFNIVNCTCPSPGGTCL